MRTNQALKDLHLPRCNWMSFIRFTGEGPIPQADIEALDHYFQHFVELGPCIKCGRELTGILGTFKYGVQNGEGHCVACGWPARAIHRNVGPIQTLQLVIQYHPDVVTWDPEVE